MIHSLLRVMIFKILVGAKRVDHFIFRFILFRSFQ